MHLLLCYCPQVLLTLSLSIGLFKQSLNGTGTGNNNRPNFSHWQSDGNGTQWDYYTWWPGKVQNGFVSLRFSTLSYTPFFPVPFPFCLKISWNLTSSQVTTVLTKQKEVYQVAFHVCRVYCAGTGIPMVSNWKTWEAKKIDFENSNHQNLTPFFAQFLP